MEDFGVSIGARPAGRLGTAQDLNSRSSASGRMAITGLCPICVIKSDARLEKYNLLRFALRRGLPLLQQRDHPSQARDRPELERLRSAPACSDPNASQKYSIYWCTGPG